MRETLYKLVRSLFLTPKRRTALGMQNKISKH
jgi:hypothetical protein